jgi:activator of HSP90 ATPase
MANKSLKQTRTFNTSGKALYETLMDSKKHSKLAGGPVKISPKVGGKFDAFGGMISGSNLELKPGKKIVQAWRAGDWPECHFSRATFSFASAGKGKTKMTFTQSGIPEEQYNSIKEGWIKWYWDPMAKMLEK